MKKLKRRRYPAWFRNNVLAPWDHLWAGTLPRYVRDRYIVRFKIRPFQHIDGWLTVTEASALYRTAAALPPDGVVVEIGSWKGRSTYCLAKGLPAGGVVYAIDPFDASGEAGSAHTYQKRQGETPLLAQFEQRMTALGVMAQIRPLAGYSHQFVGQIPHIDFLFLDGDHSVAGTTADFEQYTPYLAPGGYLALHDYGPDKAEMGPVWVVENLVRPSGAYEHVGTFDSLWLGRKKGS